MTTPDQVKKAKENVMRSEGFLYIKRMPKNTADEFLTFASDVKEFNGDWGMAFKVVWDTYKGLMPRSDEAIQSQFESMYQKIIELEEKIDSLISTKDSKIISTCDGREIKTG